MTPQSRAHADPDADADDATVIRLSWHEPERFTVLFRRHAPHIQRYVIRRCNAVGVFANMLIGYGNVGITPLTWYFSLAEVPGVSVRHIIDGAGRADVEFSFPFTDGVTAILLDARTYQFAGYVNGGAQTLLLRQAQVSGPGVRP